jgi:hypothetical protein
MSLHAEPKTAAQSLALHLETNYGLQLDPARHGLLCADLDQHLRAVAAGAQKRVFLHQPDSALPLRPDTTIPHPFVPGTVDLPLCGDCGGPEDSLIHRNPLIPGTIVTAYYQDGTSKTGPAPLPLVALPSGAPLVEWETMPPVADLPCLWPVPEPDGPPPTNLAVGTVYYADGTSATGVLPLPDTSPGGAPRVPATVPEPDVTAELDAAGPPAIEQQPPAQEPPNAAA